MTRLTNLNDSGRESIALEPTNSRPDRRPQAVRLLAGMLLCGLAVSASGQNSAVAEIAPERGFTIAPNVQIPIVLKTQPDAACDLHAAGVSDPAHTMRLYANADGYVRVHVSTKQESQQDVRVQLDCTAAGKVTTYPLRLRAGSSPTDDMPAPQASMPALQGSRVLPALTDEDARKLSDRDLIGLGYPTRPDAAASPDKYEKWLDMVARPITVIPPHLVSRSDISHGLRNVEEGTEGSSNWSGYEARDKTRTFVGVNGDWNVPSIQIGEPGYKTYSALWVGLDGDGTRDLVQAGTEQDFNEIWIFNFASYSAWTELLPNQPTSQQVGLSVNPGDDIDVQVWIGNSETILDQNGGYGWFEIQNRTQHQTVLVSTALNGTYFEGSETEWIMERPGVNGTVAELSCYIIAAMNSAFAIEPTFTVPAGTAANLQITMYNANINHPDNNELSSAIPAGAEGLFFFFHNFH